MIDLRPTTLADIRAVLDDPSVTTRQEIEVAGYTTWQALKFFRDCLQEGEARTLRIDGEILFILGIAPHPLLPRRSSLWFVSREHYWRLGAKGLRIGRRILEALRERHPAEYISARSWSQHEDVERWFALLGFKHEAHHGMSRVFLLPPKIKGKADILSAI